MDRRRFLMTSLASVLATPFVAEAQPAGKVARIGVVVGGVDYTDNLRQGLRELGWVEGQNVVVLKRVWGDAPSSSPRSSPP